MASRDSQTVLLSRQAILLVTAVGVSLLTLCYVLGVQVGKQSAALRHPQTKGAGEELEELPATMADQLKALEQAGNGTGFDKPVKAPPPAPPEARPDEPPAEAKAGPAKAAEPKAKPPEAKAVAQDHWTLQLVSTPDAGEARTVAGKAKAAGFKTETLTEKGLNKVRLLEPMDRKVADAAIQRLRKHGFKPFAIKVEP